MKSKSHFPWLDLVRFLAAFMVLVVHARHFSFVDFGALQADQKSLFVAGLYAITRIGNEAVILFFVLSGFLVGGVAAVRIHDGTFRLADYAIDRFSRIMLPLVPALILSALFAGVTVGGFEFWVFVGNLLSLQGVLVNVFGGNAPLWSLSYEVWFYILVGGIGLLMLKGNKYCWGGILILVFMAVFTKLAVVYLFCWLIGALAYVYRPNHFGRKLFVSSMILVFSAIALVELTSPSDSLSVGGWRMYLPSAEISKLLLAIGMSLFIQQTALLHPKREFSIKINYLGTTLATFAYTLYLTHYPILQLAAYFGVARSSSIQANAVGVFFLEIFVCMLVAWLVYLLAEKHTNHFRQWMKAKLIPAKL